MAIRTLNDSRNRGVFVTLLAQAVGSLLIVAAARGDLWFDEIWSIHLLRDAASLVDVFGIRHDNNHVLSSLYLWLLGTSAPLYAYRLLAVACGIGSLLVIARIARRWTPAERLASVVLAGTSYPLLLYFSEARGYAPALFLALAAYALVQESDKPTGTRVALFWIVSILGVLAHLTFVFVTAALMTVRRGRYVALHGVPVLFIGFWYLAFIRDMSLNARLRYSVFDVAAQVGSLLIGTPERWPGVIAVIAVLAVVAGGAWVLRRSGDAMWPFYPALAVAPLAAVLILRPDFLYARYFAVFFPFFYLLLARLLCRVSVKWAVAALVAVLVMAQSGRVWSLLAVGRGQYSRALAAISAANGPRRIVLGSDNDFRTTMLLTFYAPRLRHPGGFFYVARSDWRRTPPEWFIAQTQDFEKQPAPMGALAGGVTYRLVDEYPYSGLSGWRWFVYRRIADRVDSGATGRQPSAFRLLLNTAPSASRPTE